MNDHKSREQADALSQAGKWQAVATACSMATSALAMSGVPLSRYLSRRFGVLDEAMLVALGILAVIWIGVTIYCAKRGRELRDLASGQKPWRQVKQEFAEDLARAEAFLGIEK